MKYMISIELHETEIKSKEQVEDVWKNLRRTKNIINNHIAKFDDNEVYTMLERYQDYNHDRLVFNVIMCFKESLSIEEQDYIKKITIDKKGVITSHMEDWNGGLG